MSQRVEVVWPDEFVARIDVARGDVPRTKWIQRACEAALAPVEKEPATEAGSGEDGRVSPAGLPASSRQAFKCPDRKCDFRASSARAVCGKHGRTVVAA